MLCGRARVCISMKPSARALQVHCTIRCDGEGHWVLEDAGSLNGSMLNGRKVTRGPLRRGDIITLGNGGKLMPNQVLLNCRDHDVVFRFDHN